MARDQPPLTVRRAFGVSGPAIRLEGGQGTSWVAADLVLKPEGGPTWEWLAAALADLVADGFRLATPVRTQNGEWTCAGWSATRWVAGSAPDYAAASTWPAILAAGRAFHRAVARLARADVLDTRQDWWAWADRVAWGERAMVFRPELADLARRLRGALQPLGRPQLVHGDLTGNVLFAAGLAPAVIDIAPYWRPPAYAEGVIVVDAICWHDASASIVDSMGVSVPAVARALLFRMATTNERVAAAGAGVDLHDEIRRYALAVDAIGL